MSPTPPPRRPAPRRPPRLARHDAWHPRVRASRPRRPTRASGAISASRSTRPRSRAHADRDGRAAADARTAGPFVHVAALLREAGVHAPAVLAQDLAQGFLLLTDLGDTTYLAALRRAAAAPRSSPTRPTRWCAGSSRAAKACCRLRRGAAAPRARALPGMVRRTPPRRDADGARSAASLEDVFRASSRHNLAQPRVFVHRDFMPRNLMVSDAQSRRPRLPGRRATARSPTTSCRSAATPS